MKLVVILEELLKRYLAQVYQILQFQKVNYAMDLETVLIDMMKKTVMKKLDLEPGNVKITVILSGEKAYVMEK